MTRYKKFDSYLWNDMRFSRLSNRAKLLFLYIVTHPQMTSIGAMKCSRAALKEELRIVEQIDFDNSFFDLLQLGYIKYDREHALLYVPCFTEMNIPETPAVIRSWTKLFEFLPVCKLLVEAFETAGYIIHENDRRGYLKVFNQTIRPLIAKATQEIERLQQQHPPQKLTTVANVL